MQVASVREKIIKHSKVLKYDIKYTGVKCQIFLDYTSDMPGVLWGRDSLPFASTWINTRYLVGSVLLIFFINLCCWVFVVALFVIFLCLEYPMLQVSPDWPFLVAPSVSSNVYCGVRIALSIVFCVCFVLDHCIYLFLLSFWWIYCLSFFGEHLMITLLVSSKFSPKKYTGTCIDKRVALGMALGAK